MNAHCGPARLAALLILSGVSPLFAQQASRPKPRLAEKIVVDRPGDPEPVPASGESSADPLLPLPGEHPMMPALRWAKSGMDDLRNIKDYSAMLVKRERIDGLLAEHQHMLCKVRHEPFSVYLKFLSPTGVKGQEVIFVAGRDNGQMQAHATGLRKSVAGTAWLDPRSPMAMRGHRYPITEAGLLNLTERLVEVGEHDTQYGECVYKAYRGAKVNGRVCTCLQFTHPKPRKEFRFHLARVFIDDELNLPIRYEAYDWPREEGGKPPLTEEYTYLDLKLNNGFTDIDFDVKNPKYEFPQ